MKTLFCEQCGAKREDSASFCQQCGTRFEDNTESSNEVSAEKIFTAPEPIADTPAASVEKASEVIAPPSAVSVAPNTAAPIAPEAPKAAAPVSVAPKATAPTTATAAPEAPIPSPETFKTSAPAAVLDAPAEAMPQSKPTVQQSTASKIATIIVSVILSLMLFGNICAGIGILIMRELIDKNNLTEICDDTDLIELKVGNAIMFDDRKAVDDDATLPEWISANLDPLAVSKYGMTPDGVSKILDKSTIKEFTKTKLLEVAAYMRGETDDAKITADELVQLLRDNADIIYDATGYEFIQEDYDNFYAFLKESNAFEDSDTLSIATDLNYAGRFTRMGLSIYSLIILGVFTLAIAIVIIVINKRSARFSMLYLGIASLAAGLPFVAAGIGMLISPSFIPLDEVSSKLASAMCDSLSNITLLSGICFTLIGGVFIAIYAIINVIRKKKSLSEAK